MNSRLTPPVRIAAIVLLALSLAGCLGTASNPGSNNTTNTKPIPVEERSTRGSVDGDVTEQSNNQTTAPQAGQAALGKNRVTLALLEKSEVARGQGNLKEAVTHIERAIRINPRRADLWVQLAQLQLALNQPTIAEGYARKAISLAGSRLDWQRDAWLVIADAKQAQGMTGEAAAIRQRWRTAAG